MMTFDKLMRHDDFTLRFEFAKSAPAPDLIARNQQKIDAARKNVAPTGFRNLVYIPVDDAGCITGKDLKAFLQEQGFDLGALAMRSFAVSRVPHAIARGTDRDGGRHYDHGRGDCDLAMREHGMYPAGSNYAKTTFVSSIKHLLDDRVIDTQKWALSIYRQDCLYPLESSIGNLSSGFHLFLTSPQQALLAVAHHEPTTQKHSAAMFAEEHAYIGKMRECF